jgi:hypothetical protein
MALSGGWLSPLQPESTNMNTAGRKSGDMDFRLISLPPPPPVVPNPPMGLLVVRFYQPPRISLPLGAV